MVKLSRFSPGAILAIFFGYRKSHKAAICLLSFLMLGGCAGMPTDQQTNIRFGWPSSERIRHAAVSAATDTHVWLPMAGALVFSAADLDDNLSQWAVEKTPLFGSDADDASDILLTLTSIAHVGTALAVNDGSNLDKLSTLGMGMTTVSIARRVTKGLKRSTGRLRPNGADRMSFPSGHATKAATQARLAVQNLDHIVMPQWMKVGTRIGIYGAAAGAAWARVESENHYPSDVLVGYGIGNFFAKFMQELFIDRVYSRNPTNSFAANTNVASLVFKPMYGGGAFTLTVPLGVRGNR